jgi:hypothetical protein
MTCQQLLNSIGLVLNMIGVLVIFRYGPPQPTHEPGIGLGLEDNNRLEDGRTVAEHKRDVEKNKKLYSCMSKIGLGLVFIGFAVQLWATWS